MAFFKRAFAVISHQRLLRPTSVQVAFKQAHLQQVLPHITNIGTSIQQEVG